MWKKPCPISKKMCGKLSHFKKKLENMRPKLEPKRTEISSLCASIGNITGTRKYNREKGNITEKKEI